MTQIATKLAWLVARGELDLDYAESIVANLGETGKFKSRLKKLEEFHWKSCRADSAIRDIIRTAPALLQAKLEPSQITKICQDLARGEISDSEIRLLLRSIYKSHILVTQKKLPPAELVKSHG